VNIRSTENAISFTVDPRWKSVRSASKHAHVRHAAKAARDETDRGTSIVENHLGAGNFALFRTAIPSKTRAFGSASLFADAAQFTTHCGARSARRQPIMTALILWILKVGLPSIRAAAIACDRA
jgi:hypothetical protein